LQELVSHLLDLATAKSVVVSIPHYLSMKHVKEVIEHIRRFISQMADRAKEKLEKVKGVLEPLIAKAIEHSGADSEKLKGLLAELTTFAHHSKVPFT